MTDPTLSRAVARIAPSRTNAITDRAMELRAEGRDIISLSVGEPDFATPDFVKQAAIEAIRAGKTKYTGVDGTPEMKAALRACVPTVIAARIESGVADLFVYENR